MTGFMVEPCGHGKLCVLSFQLQETEGTPDSSNVRFVRVEQMIEMSGISNECFA